MLHSLCIGVGECPPSIEMRTFLRAEREVDRRRDDVPDCLHFPVFAVVEYSVKSRADRQTSRIVVRGPEMVEHLSLDILHLAGLLVVNLFGLPEEPVHSVGEARGDVYVLEQREVGKTDLEIVGHTVAHLVPESRLVELRSLEVYAVL